MRCCVRLVSPDRNSLFHFIDAQYATLDAIAEELGPRFAHLGYPLSHTRDVGFMEAHWCANDPWHSNKHYGAQVMKQIGARVAS